jgi:uncharacterized damage-inducible protein DinB
MDSTAEVLLESWDRQAQIIANIGSRIDESNRYAKASEDGWPVDEQLAHVHESRYYWLTKVAPEVAKSLGDVYVQVGEEWKAIPDLPEIKRQVGLSSAAVRTAVGDAIEAGITQFGPYTHPIMFMQHMIWHEGYHFALIVLALRNAGQEPPEEWEDANVWGLWRTA